jgi:hypothetical protein
MAASIKPDFSGQRTYQGNHRDHHIWSLAPRALTLARCTYVIVALAIGIWSLSTAHDSAIGQYGLIQTLPVLYFLCLVMLSVSFLIVWSSSELHSLEFCLNILSLVILLQGAPGIIESDPRFPVAWLHAGFTNYVANTGHVLPTIDARFSWPSFFTGMAMIDRVGGLSNAILVIRWWPVFINLLYIPPLYLLAKILLKDKKRAMLAVWLFPFANWVGQDYYSPQSVAYLLYMVLICVVLGPFGINRRALSFLKKKRSRRHHFQKEMSSDWKPQTLGYALTLIFVMLILCVAIDTGHQLTPIFAVATVALLIFFGRTRLLVWPGVMLLLAAGWVCYAAVAYWSGHLSVMFGGLSSVGVNYSSDLRLHGSVSHSHVNDVRLLMFVGVWGLALIGFLRSRNTQVNRVAAAVIMLTPLLTVAGQSYGGEAGLRAFLFSLPGALCLVATALTPTSVSLKVAFISVLTIVLIPGFLVARWGNELFEMVTPTEIAGMNALYRIAPAGATIVSITPLVTWQYKDVGQYQYAPNNLDEFAFGSVSSITAQMGNPRGNYVIITMSQLIYAQESYGLPANWGTGVEQKLKKSHVFRLRYSNSEAQVYQYIGLKR